MDFDIFFKVLDEIGFDGYNMIERNDYFDELDGMSQSINFAKEVHTNSKGITIVFVESYIEYKTIREM